MRRRSDALVVAWAVVLAMGLLASTGCGPAGKEAGGGGRGAPGATGWDALVLRLNVLGLGGPGSETSPGREASVAAGSPLLLELVVDNLEEVRAVNARHAARSAAQGPVGEQASAVVVDGEDAWEARVAFEVTSGDGSPVQASIDWTGALQGGVPSPAGRSVGFEVQRALWVLAPEDTARLGPGEFRIVATLAPADGRGAPLRSEPLTLTVAPGAAADDAQALYRRARALALRGDQAGALAAAQAALAADPELHDAMEVIATAHLQLGDRQAAIAWYERYLRTFTSDDERDGYPRVLRRLIESLKRQ